MYFNCRRTVSFFVGKPASDIHLAQAQQGLVTQRICLQLLALLFYCYQFPGPKFDFFMYRGYRVINHIRRIVPWDIATLIPGLFFPGLSARTKD